MPGLTLDEIFAEVDVIRERMRQEHPGEPRVTGARYDHATSRVLVELSNGCLFGFPVWMVPGTSRATPDELERIELEPFGEAVLWTEINADVHVTGLMLSTLNVKTWAAKYLGSTTSPAKAEAARENGKKGGRPRKQRGAEG
ncbi:MAG TPA: DUF2442 domain-containing protein [Longimicrobium sp.]|jgi:hypothetical protein|uniref:DUF2442 domain-containing protein n=1 Tax=Longimicrobium sp. TaxID=2029185 RepID=UPI002ED79B6D